MIRQSPLKYFCDECDKQILDDAVYGPLVIDLTAPHFTTVRVRKHFCSTDCAATWISKKAGEALS